MKKLLYTSGDVRKSVIELFDDSTRHRVAVTAFVGSGAEAYLPNPKGLQLYCWPKAGGTDPDVLRKLIKRGAEVFFVDGLHMKVYWSEDKGAVVTSANLSTNALGSGNLKEIGVFLEPKEIDIDRIIQSLKIRSVSSKELKKLDLHHKQYVARNRGEGRRGFRMRSYLEWYKEPSRPEWKLGVVEGTVELASDAKAKSKNRYGVKDPEDWISCSYGEYREGD